MDDRSSDDDNGEVRWSWRRDESGRGKDLEQEQLLKDVFFAFTGNPH